MFYALRIEKFKKQHNLRTYRQLVAYDQGRSLSEIEEAEERGKAPYEGILIPILFVLGIGAIALLFSWLLLTFFLSNKSEVIRPRFSNVFKVIELQIVITLRIFEM